MGRGSRGLETKIWGGPLFLKLEKFLLGGSSSFGLGNVVCEWDFGSCMVFCRIGGMLCMK